MAGIQARMVADSRGLTGYRLVRAVQMNWDSGTQNDPALQYDHDRRGAAAGAR
jgi:hypothetical protein